MPVSHLGLTVSHIPSATSFYLSALQPLGYRYIGQRGDAVGLGIDEADFFLCQEPNGFRLAPTHVAFAANHRSTVRECYAAALDAGARPSGPPSYRNDDCGCFNAAVVDLDGNTLEFIWRDVNLYGDQRLSAAYRPRESVARSTYEPSEASAPPSRRPSMKSRAQTALDLAPSSSKPPSPGLVRSRTEPVDGTSSKALIGTVLGAAAGAALAYAMCKAEQDNSRNEARYNARSSYRGRQTNERSTRTSRRSASAAPAARLESGYSAVDSRSSRRDSLALPPTLVRAIDSKPYYPDNQAQSVMSRFARGFPPPSLSRTYGKSEYAPPPATEERYSLKRATTLPLEMSEAPKLLLEAPNSTTSRRSERERDDPDSNKQRRHDSVVSSASNRSHRYKESSRRSSTSQASTIKPAKRSSVSYGSAANIPLPPSRAPSHVSSRISAIKPPSQPSRPVSYATARESPSRRHSYVPAAPTPPPIAPPIMPDPRAKDDAYDSDGLDDMRTVVPEDSISCIDLPRRAPSVQSPRSERAHKPLYRIEGVGEMDGRPLRKVRASLADVPLRRERERSDRRSNMTYT